MRPAYQHDTEKCHNCGHPGSEHDPTLGDICQYGAETDNSCDCGGYESDSVSRWDIRGTLEDPSVEEAAIELGIDTTGMTEEEKESTVLSALGSLDPNFSSANKAALESIHNTVDIKTPAGNVPLGQSAFWQRPMCSHAPQKVIEGKTWAVWAGTKSTCLRRALRFPVILNLSQYSVLPDHKIPIKSLKKWEKSPHDTQEIILDWPDGDVVSLPAQFWVDLRNYLEESKSEMLVFCLGGHGRTGTAVACILVAGGWKADNAIEWIRKNYCKEAIENKWQEYYVKEIETQLKEKP